MAEQFKDQGGAASMDPGPFYRWVTSRVVRRICSPQRQHKEDAVGYELADPGTGGAADCANTAAIPGGLPSK